MLKHLNPIKGYVIHMWGSCAALLVKHHMVSVYLIITFKLNIIFRCLVMNIITVHVMLVRHHEFFELSNSSTSSAPVSMLLKLLYDTVKPFHVDM